MSRHLFGWDLPPGVRVSDIPGNRPEDEDWERIYDNFWNKERLTKTHIGIRITEADYARMDKLYNSKLSSLIDDYIGTAIEYGTEIGNKQNEDTHQENRLYEAQFITEALEKSGVAQEVIDKVNKILKGDYETP